MKSILSLLFVVVGLLAFSSSFAARQSAPPESGSAAEQSIEKSKEKKPAGPGKEIGKGAGDVGKGVGKGSADLGKGAAGSAGNLATGHPVKAGASLGKGAAGFGKDVAVGAGKGTVKVGKGVGGEFKKVEKKIGGQ